MRAEDVWQRFRHAPAALCANPPCARTVRFAGELCDRCSSCYACEHRWPAHEHVERPRCGRPVQGGRCALPREHHGRECGAIGLRRSA